MLNESGEVHLRTRVVMTLGATLFVVLTAIFMSGYLPATLSYAPAAHAQQGSAKKTYKQNAKQKPPPKSPSSSKRKNGS